MIVIEQEMKLTNITKDILCDSCGKSCKTEYGGDHMNLHANWGFMTSKDLEKWTAQLCETCVDKLLTFVKFKKETYL